jgi:hypothetical protein
MYYKSSIYINNALFCFMLQISLDRLAVTQLPLKLGLRRKALTLLFILGMFTVWSLTFRTLLLEARITVDDVLHLIGLIYSMSLSFVWAAVCTSLRKTSERMVGDMKV